MRFSVIVQSTSSSCRMTSFFNTFTAKTSSVPLNSASITCTQRQHCAHCWALITRQTKLPDIIHTLPKLPFPSTLMKEKSSSIILLVWTVFTSPFSLASPVSSDSPSVREEDEAGFSSSPRWSNESAFLMFSRSFISADHKTKSQITSHAI